MQKKSFFERLTGSIRLKEEEEEQIEDKPRKLSVFEKDIPEGHNHNNKEENWEEEAELTVDVYETKNEIIVQTMVAGVTAEHLSIMITRDSITIRGKREDTRSESMDFHVQELYWGSFTRTIALPEEVDPDEAEAIEKHGLLIIKMPKIDKNKETKIKIKSI